MSEKTRTLHNDIILLNNEENQKSQDFLENQIYSCITRDWNHNSSALSKEYIEYLGKFHIPDEVQSKLSQIHQHWHQIYVEESTSRKERESARLFRTFSEFRRKLEFYDGGKIQEKDLRKLQ